MARPKKVKVLSDKEWLNTNPEPSEIDLAPNGGYHIPIEKLRPLLDRLNACVKNYHSSIGRNGYDSQVYGSIELTVTIDGVERTVTGAYNLPMGDAPNGFWNGTLKSECVKNAAIELGKRFGRELNKDMPKPEQTQATQTVATRMKAKPDDKIMQQFKAAIERGDEAAITTLNNIYEIKLINDANGK